MGENKSTEILEKLETNEKVKEGLKIATLEDAKQEDIFVHYSAIRQDGYKTLSEGQMVEFKLIETAKGYQALDVTPVSELVTA